jgi:hypothetical protein
VLRTPSNVSALISYEIYVSVGREALVSAAATFRTCSDEGYKGKTEILGPFFSVLWQPILLAIVQA